MNTNVNLFLILFLILFTFLDVSTERFTNLNSLNDNNKKMVKFCKRLKQFDKPSEHTIMLRNFQKRKLNKNKKKIKEIMDEIEYLQKQKFTHDIEKINDYKCRVQKKAKKQIEAINKAKNNIQSRNTINLNLTNY